MNDDVLEIFCDEAGHTGPDLLNLDQKYFAFASVAVPNDEAWQIIDETKRTFRIQMPELKGSKLTKTVNGRKFITKILSQIEGRYAITASDKLLALCGWVFEYIYEPVFQRNPKILYQKNLHRFLAMYTYVWIMEYGENSNEAVRQFQKYMRTLDVSVAPLLFSDIENSGKDEEKHPFMMILEFARGYKSIIIADNNNLSKHLPQAGRWILDLSASSLWSHINYWGQKNRPLKINCDHSKPLEAEAANFTEKMNDGISIYRKEMLGMSGNFKWKLDSPIELVDSRDHPSVQLADMVASTYVSIRSKGLPDDFTEVGKAMDKHILKDSIFPDFDIIDTSQKAPAVNWLVLFHLAQQAKNGVDPSNNLEDVYKFAESSWSKDIFKKSE